MYINIPINLQITHYMFGFTHSHLFPNLSHDIDPFWNISPYDAFEFVNNFILYKKLFSIISNMSLEEWKNHVNKKIDVLPILNNETEYTNNQINIIGITGKKYSGKDTCAAYYVNNYGYTRFALADPIKNICKIVFMFSEEQLYGNLKEELDHKWNLSPRYVFQFFGTDIVRDNMHILIPNINNDFWIRTLVHHITTSKSNKVVISDIRFQNEINLIKKQFNSIFIRIKRASINHNDFHISESYIDSLDYIDHDINNDYDLYKLYEIIDSIVQ